MMSAMETSGFCFLSVRKTETAVVARAMAAARRYFDKPIDVRKAARLNCSFGKFVGSAIQTNREFFQVRKLPKGRSSS